MGEPENAEATRLLRETVRQLGRLAPDWEELDPEHPFFQDTDTYLLFDDEAPIWFEHVWPAHRARRRTTIKVSGWDYIVVGDIAYDTANGGLVLIPSFPVAAVEELEDGSIYVSQWYDDMGYLEEGDIEQTEMQPALYPILVMSPDRKTLHFTDFYATERISAWAGIQDDIREDTINRYLDYMIRRAKEIYGDPFAKSEAAPAGEQQQTQGGR